MGEQHPRLRQVEIFPIQHNGQRLLCLRDPFHFTDNVVTVSIAAIPILQRLDGAHSLPEIQAEMLRTTQQTVPLAQLQGFVDRLDEALMLASSRFHKHHDELVRKFRESSVRAAAHAGGSYPQDPAEITRMFSQHTDAPKGPGTNGTNQADIPAAIVSPHIDLRRGGPAFAWAYQQLAHASNVDTFIILGVAHAPTKNRFAGTLKHYQTPFGSATTDVGLMKKLAGMLSFDLFEDEFVHRSEHSIEFQVVYLQHSLRERRKFQIAPILIGSFHDLVHSGREPVKDPQVASFCRALRQTLSDSSKKICVIAGVDLAHVGGRFGDEFTVNKEVLAQIETDDREMLKILENCDPARFFRMIQKEQDCRRICGFPTLYTMLSSLDVKQGRLLCYDQSYEKNTNSVVSFASMSFS